MRVRVRNVRMLALVLILAFIGQAQAFASVPFQGTGMDAGGFQSTIAADPFHQGVLLSGADVSGFNRSTDTGDTWSLSNGGINDRQLMQTAAIAFSQQTSNKVYSGQGTAGGNGGFVVSTDGGKSWEVRNTSIQFVGGNTKDSSTLPDPHPRSTGNLIALDETNGYIYAGTYKDGVFRSSDDGYTWTYLGLSGSYIRSISLNPADADVLYVAAYGEKLYRMGQAQTSSPSWTQISNSPLYLEELKYIGGKMYAVGGNGSAGKVYRLDFINNANTLTELLSTTGDTIYSAIDGYDGGSQNVIFVGTTNPKANGSMYESVLRSTDGGNVWTAITINANRIHFEMGTGTNVWWLSQLNPDGMIGKNRFVASYIQVDPFSNNRIYVSGRSGVWKGDIDGSGNVDWHPIVRNMNATFNTAVLADPQQAWRAYVGNTDWGFVYSTDRMENVQANRPATNVDGFALAVDTGTTPSTVYLGTDTGEVYSNPNPNNGSWTSEGLNAATGGGKVVGVAVQRVASTPTIIAAVSGKGIWKKSGSSSWTKVVAATSALGTQSSNKASVSWVSGSAYIYVYDKETGIWRSDNNGASGSWTKIWNHPCAAPGGWQEETSCYLVADPANANNVYVSADDGLYKLTGAQTGTVEGGGVGKSKLTAVANPGPLTMTGSDLYVTSKFGSGTVAKLYKSSDGGSTFTDIGDSFYHDNAGFATDICVSGNGKIYVSLYGQGIISGN